MRRHSVRTLSVRSAQNENTCTKDRTTMSHTIQKSAQKPQSFRQLCVLLLNPCPNRLVHTRIARTETVPKKSLLSTAPMRSSAAFQRAAYSSQSHFIPMLVQFPRTKSAWRHIRYCQRPWLHGFHGTTPRMMVRRKLKPITPNARRPFPSLQLFRDQELVGTKLPTSELWMTTNKRTNGRTNERTDGRTNERTNERTENKQRHNINNNTTQHSERTSLSLSLSLLLDRFIDRRLRHKGLNASKIVSLFGILCIHCA